MTWKLTKFAKKTGETFQKARTGFNNFQKEAREFGTAVREEFSTQPKRKELAKANSYNEAVRLWEDFERQGFRNMGKIFKLRTGGYGFYRYF